MPHDRAGHVRARASARHRRSSVRAPAGRADPAAGSRRDLAGGTLTDYADYYTHPFGLARYSRQYTKVDDQAMDSIVVQNPDGGITFTLLAPDLGKAPSQLDAFRIMHSNTFNRGTVAVELRCAVSAWLS